MNTRDVGARAVAAIDVGTNTALLLIATRAPGGELEVIDDLCRTPRLGSGLASAGRLSPEAQGRTLEVLAEFAARLRESDLHGSRVRAVGTAALRRAANAREFIDRVRAETGLALEVLSEDDEARLGYAAARARGATESSILIDVGGGSTEIAAAGGATRKSAPIGAVVLTEEFLGLDGRAPLRSGGWTALCAAAARACEVFPKLNPGDSSDAVVLGGSGVNLACLELGLSRFEPARADGTVLDAASAGRWASKLAALSLEARLKLPVERERAEILPAGLACLAAVVARLGVRSLRVCGQGLRYAIARELLTDAPAAAGTD